MLNRISFLKKLILFLPRLSNTLLKYHIIYSLLFCPIIIAQPNNAAFRNLTSAEGLPTTSVTDVTQDAFGFIWIGSWDYVYRYDGNSFTQIPLSQEGRYLEADKKGGVWISFEKSVGYYDPYTDRINKYDIAYSGRYPVIGVDDSNGVWVASDEGVLKFDYSADRFIKDPEQQTDYVYGISAYGNGELLFVLRKNVNGSAQYLIGRRASDGKYDYEPFPEDLNNPQKGKSFSYGNNNQLFLRRLNSTGIVIINLYGWVYKTERGSNWAFKKPLDRNFSLWTSDARVDRNGNIWLNQLNQVSKINIKTGKISVYKHDPKNPNTVLPLNNIYAGNNMFFDRQGVLWITRFSQGISRLNLFESNFGLLKDATGSPIPDILSALELKDGSYWIGERSFNGLKHYSSNGKLIRTYSSDSENSTSGKNSPPGKSINTKLSHPFAWAMATTSDGSIWVGGGSPGPHMGGINRIRPGTNQITRFKNDPNDSNSITGDWIFKILVDGSDRVWISPESYPNSNGEICFIDPKTEKVTRGVTEPNSDSSRDYELHLTTTSGDLIVGNNDHTKTFIIDHKTLKISPFGIASPPEAQLHYSEQDGEGRFWFISTFGFGYLDSLHKNVEYLYEVHKNNFPANRISGLKLDKEGKIWLSTDNGIFQFDLASEQMKHFGFERGLQSINYEFRVNYKGPSGKIYFAGNGGINIFDPEDIYTNPYPPEMVFTSLKLDGKSIKFGEDSAIRKPIFIADKIIVNPDVMTISIDFSAIHFAGFKDNKYLYKLEGFDNNWVDGGNIGNATYTNLSPGEYTLFIKGCNWDGVWSDGNKSIVIVILPPWWQTWWAYAIYMLGFIGMLAGIRRFELNRRQAKEDKRILELENKRKSEELEQARKLQLSMLPKEIPALSNLDISVYLKTATEVGGDFYDFIKHDEKTLDIFIGDATGHGLDAGMMVSISKGLFSRVAQETTFENIINQFNNSLHSMNLQPMYMSSFFIRVQHDYLQIVGAGMPPALFFQNQNSLVTEIESSGPPLGGFPNFNYKVHSSKLKSGDIIVIMSDGFSERRNITKQLFGWDKGKEILNQVKDLNTNKIIEEFIRINNEWGESWPQDDDITIIVLKVQ